MLLVLDHYLTDQRDQRRQPPQRRPHRDVQVLSGKAPRRRQQRMGQADENGRKTHTRTRTRTQCAVRSTDLQGGDAGQDVGDPYHCKPGAAQRVLPSDREVHQPAGPRDAGADANRGVEQTQRGRAGLLGRGRRGRGEDLREEAEREEDLNASHEARVLEVVVGEDGLVEESYADRDCCVRQRRPLRRHTAV